MRILSCSEVKRLAQGPMPYEKKKKKKHIPNPCWSDTKAHVVCSAC